MRRWIICAAALLMLTGCVKKKSATGDSSTGGTTAKIPAKSTLLAPAQNSVCISGQATSATQSQVLFSWSSTANTDSYNLVIENLLTGMSTTQNVSTTQATATLLQNTPYSWYVSSTQNSSTTTTQSDTWKFYNSGAGVITYAPFPAELTSPVYGQIITTTNGTVNLTWNGSSVSNNISAYNVYFGTPTSPPLFKSAVADSFVNNVAVTHGTTYYWHVVTLDINGNFSDSGIYQFTVQ